MNGKDFSKYAYFVSKAKNFAIVIRPDKKKVVDGEVQFLPGLRMEFNNGMLAVEKTKENNEIINILRGKIGEYSSIDPKRRPFFEEQPPKEMVPLEKVNEIYSEQNKEIERLKAENELLKKNNKPAKADDKK